MSASTSAIPLSQILERILIAAIILGITYLLGYAFNRIVIRAVGRRSRSSAYEIGRVGSIIIWVVGIVSILPVLGASDIVVAVVILLVGAFLIIATRDFTSNWFAGQMIKTLAPFRVGDWIKTADGSYGRVSRVEGLFTILVTPQNEMLVIPNNKLTSDQILDRTTSGSLKVPIDLELGQDVEFGELTAAVSKITKDLAQYLPESEQKTSGPEIHVLSKTSDHVNIRVFLRIENPAKEEEVASEFRKRFSVLALERQTTRFADRRDIEP
jgi:small conductance mechanosensitive channel